jgi:hypothetical protein
MIRRYLTGAIGLALGFALLTGASASGDIKELSWAELMPPVTAKPTKKLKTFFINPSGSSGDLAPSPLPEGKWMSMKRQQPGADRPPEVVTALDGERVRIGGYVVPLDFNATRIIEFLLVPFVGACIHVPPPPTNQIVYVKAPEGFEAGSDFDPVWVTGTLKVETADTGLAVAGYSLAADQVEVRPQ